MLLRVVGDKYDPSKSYAAPSATSSPSTLPSLENSPEDLALLLLPTPTHTLNRRECLETARTKGAKLKLARLLHLEGDRSHETRIEMESAAVKQYSLDNAPARFRALMTRDERYARAVREVLALKRGGSRRAYLVDGFMTAEDATWSRGVKKGVSAGVGVTVVPPLDGVGVAGMGVEADASVSRHVGRESVWMSPGEEVFAVSYLEVRLQGEGFLGTGTKVPVVGDTVVANNSTAALGSGGPSREVARTEESDSEDDSDESEDEVELESEDVEIVVLEGIDQHVLEELEHFLEI